MEGVATECSNSSDAVKDFEKTKIKLNGEMNGTMETMEVDADSHDSEYKKDSEDDTNDGSSRVNNGGDHSSEGGEHSGEDDSQDADSSHSKLKISENSNSHPGYPNESMEVDGESMNSEEANMLNSDNERSVKSQNIDAEMMEETEEDEDDEERDINKDDNESREAKSNKDVVELDSDHSKSGTEGKHNGECETKKEADSTNSNETTPKKKKENEVVITPRRSSRTVQKPVRFGQDPNNDSSEEEDIQGNDSDEIEEITPQDPLADTLDIRKIPRKIGNTTIVINDTKRLQDIAARASNNQKKEPTLVIIDTNSILSGRGAVPMAQPSSQSHLPAVTVTPQTHLPSHQSSSLPQQPHHIKPYPNLPAALPAQGLYPPPKPVQRPPPPILPTLTDDMYVVEAPSFIVPYVYEKPPVKKFRKYLRKLHKEVKRVDEELKKEEEEEERKEKEKEEKEKEEKEKQEKEKDKEGDKDAKKETDEGDSAKKEEDSEKSESGSSVADKKLEPGENVSADAKVEVKDSEKKVSSSCDSIEDSIKVTEIKKKEDGDVTVKETTPKKIKVGKKEGESSSSDEEDDEEEEKKKPTTGGSYFDNPLGKFFMQIGVNLVQEFVQTDLLKQHKKKQKLGKGTEDTQQAIISLKKNLQISKENNEPYAMEQNKCDYCSFKTESKLIMAHHLETPHMRNYVYRCNFCPLEVRSPHDILMHMEAEHNIRGRLERAPAFHQCPQCPFEDNQKGKLTRHLLTCAKKFRPEKNLEPPLDWEPPAKIPRMTRKPPPNMPINVPNPLYQQAYVTKNMQNPLLPKMVSTLNNQQNAALMRARGRPNFQPVPQGPTPKIISPRPLPPQLIRNMVYRPGSQQTIVPAPPYQITGNQIFQVMGPQGQVMNVPANSSAMQRLGFTTSQAASVTSNPSNQKNPAAVNKLLNHANISITPLPRQPLNGPSTSATTITPRQAGDPKTKHLTCEICEGYVKDLELLRNHMQWIHKVKIHPKMIYNRPPLNCQKCQSRFFTDQGLERHLLGSHGLVTTSMQEDANKGKDGGRCPICGKVYQWKLLNHVSRDHNKTLKPAHLSYKCTVCTATFGMYKQFENHVYSAHSNVAKRVMEKRNGQSSSGVVNRPDTATLLKPLKINDEITIIPQPAKKPTTSSTQPRPVPGISRVSIQPRILPQQSSKPQTDSVQVIDLEDSPLKSSGSMDGGNVESLTTVKERLRRRKSLEIRQVESEPDHSEGESEDYERESTSRSKVNSANEEEDEDSRTENENTKGNDDDEEDEDDDERNPDKGHEDENDESDG